MSNPLLIRRRGMMGSMKKDYIQFEDPEVERICIANFSSDGIGVTRADAAAVTTLPVATFRGNTDIVTFDEFKYFTGLTTIKAGSSTSALGAFGGCTSLASIEIPESVTTIGAYAFYGCSGMTELIIPTSVTSIGTRALNGLSNVSLLYIPVSTTSSVINGSGKDGGTLFVNGNYTTERNYESIKFSNTIISGNFRTSGNCGFTNSTNFHTIRINGNYISTGGSNLLLSGASNALVRFIEVNGSVTGALFYLHIPGTSSATVYHFGSSQIALTTTQFANYNATANNNVIARASKFLVGNGTSRANDEAVLALYLADTDWATYSAKLATWYDYNGEYKWYYVTDNLTNCTNTNPEAWPHITRGDSYETTIEAEDGYTLQSVQVMMYQCQDDTATPDNPTDITSQVYDASTGRIYIEHVVGNVIITAVAS